MRVIGSIVDSYFPLLAAEARANAVGREIAAETGYDPSKPPKERGSPTARAPPSYGCSTIRRPRAPFSPQP